MDPRAREISRKDILGVQHIAQSWEFPEAPWLRRDWPQIQRMGVAHAKKLLKCRRRVAVGYRSRWIWQPGLLHELYPLLSGPSCQ